MRSISKSREMILCITAFTVISATAAWLFYDSFIACLVFVPFFPIFRKAARAYHESGSRRQLTDEFIKMLSSLSSSLAAGISAENAFVMAETDMGKMLGGAAPIVRELNIINSRIATGTRVSDALFDLAKRTRIPEIYDFAVVFSVASENGADCPSVISSCTQLMEAKRQAESDAATLIRSKQYEQRVMCIILPGILAYLRISSGQFISVLYHNPLGITIMSACLFVYVFAVYLAEKIGDIKV